MRSHHHHPFLSISTYSYQNLSNSRKRIQLCRPIFSHSQPRGSNNFSKSGGSVLALASSLVPHTQGRWDRHVSTSSEDKTPPKPQNPSEGTSYKFPRNIKNLVFLDSTDDVTNAKRKDGENKPWHGLSFLRSSLSVDEITSAISSWSWPASLAALQEKSAALLLELSRGPGSLFSQIVNDPPDPRENPECEWDAEVRLSDELCVSERAFLRERKRKMRRAFSHLFGVDESELDERDLPVVAIAGSGGGFRAMVNTTGSLVGAKKSGIFDCTTYMAGISGSCWALGVLYSGVAGTTEPKAAAEHITERIRTSYVDMSTLDMLTNPPTNKYLLSGLLRKANGPAGAVSLVDLYGTLIAARLFVPSDIERLDAQFLSLHHFRKNVDSGILPMPIFTAIRHEIPIVLEKPLAEVQGAQRLAVDSERRRLFKREEEQIEKLSSWLWFEFTPFEVGCDELGAWIPSWSLGRRFENGKSVGRNLLDLPYTIYRRPLARIYASAFCASLQHYFNEVQPVLRQLPTQLYGWLNDIVMENSKEIGVLHPVEPDELPNFVKGMAGQLRENSPPDITERETLGFMLNIPYYPLFRRDVDCIISLDASADSQDLWFTRAEEYAARRGISTWPKGARWPALVQPSEKKPGLEPGSQAPRTSSDTANRTLAEAQEREASEQARKAGERDGREQARLDAVDRSSSSSPKVPSSENSQSLPGEGTEGDAAARIAPGTRPMSACTIWMGSSAGLQDSICKARDGIAIVYNPLIPNEAVPGFDPMSVSTWSFSMEKTETEKLLTVAGEGEKKIVKLLRAIWLRKKTQREKSEKEHNG
ncbi:acyl transferase/acyl hydrolase/lysophospholipase [Phellopilus nigrolimitatus]|nr:acyl transferase/acyl hydrolase/lysophospholipase [Phellopilus nigrolimitatus]